MDRTAFSRPPSSTALDRPFVVKIKVWDQELTVYQGISVREAQKRFGAAQTLRSLLAFEAFPVLSNHHHHPPVPSKCIPSLFITKKPRLLA